MALLKNWDTISTWQEVLKAKPNNQWCELHCWTKDSDYVCNKWELCWNKIQSIHDEVKDDLDIIFTI